MKWTPGSEENLRAAMRQETFMSSADKAVFESHLKQVQTEPKFEDLKATFPDVVKVDEQGKYEASLNRQQARKWYDMKKASYRHGNRAADLRDAATEKVSIVSASGESMRVPAHLEARLAASGKVKAVTHWGRRRRVVGYSHNGQWVSCE